MNFILIIWRSHLDLSGFTSLKSFRRQNTCTASRHQFRASTISSVTVGATTAVVKSLPCGYIVPVVKRREREREKRCCLFMRKTNSYLCRITYIINIFVFFEQGHPEGSVASPARQFERSHVDFNSLGRYLHKFVSCTCLAGGGTAWFRFWILSVGVHPGIHHVFSDSGHVAKRSGTLSNHPLLFGQAPREIFRFLFLLNSCW